MLAEKKRGKNKKNKLEEIVKPRGFDRELEVDKIVGATDCTGPLLFLVKWHGCEEFDLVPSSQVNEKSPHSVIEFYEQRCMLNRKCKERQRVQDQYELDLIEYPPAEDVVVEIDAEDDKQADPNSTDAVPEVVPETTTDATTLMDTSTVTDPTLNESMSVAEMSTADGSTTDLSKLDETNTTTEHIEESSVQPSQLQDSINDSTGVDTTVASSTEYTEEPQQTQAIPDDIEMPNTDEF